MIDNGWVRIDTESGTGSTAVSATVLQKNTGRSEERSVTLVGVNAHGETATATIKQDPADLFITVDHFEDEKGALAVKLAAVGGIYYIVGYANVDFMSCSETTSPKTYTDMSVQGGMAYSSGFTLIDGIGISHSIQMETSIAYGTDVQYTFKIPFEMYNNDSVSDRVIYFELSDDGDTRTATTVTQSGVQQNDET